ncbi:hypothetical protein LINPERPRIM_LOCUS6857, partial [Linum perenne]
MCLLDFHTSNELYNPTDNGFGWQQRPLPAHLTR